MRRLLDEHIYQQILSHETNEWMVVSYTTLGDNKYTKVGEMGRDEQGIKFLE